MKNYPKVLIIGQSFDRTTGGGITLSNLFEGWRKDKIAVASTNIDLTQTSICSNYYQIGNDEEMWIFPFNKIQRKVKSGRIPASLLSKRRKLGAKTAIYSRPRQKGIKEFFKKIFLFTLQFIGLYHFIYELRVSDKFVSWVKDFKPDIIYTQLSTLELINFVDKLHKLSNIPIAIHIMDDWPKTAENKGILKKYFSKKIDAEFRKILEKSFCLMCICQEMCEAYLKRYDKFFHPFHNPIDLSMWEKQFKNKWDINLPFHITYAGRIGIANQDSILDICKCISNLNKNGLNINLDIYTPDYKTFRTRKMMMYLGVNIHPSVPHNEIPSLLTIADLLVIPLDFDKKSILFAQYSMPGKTSEYMASSTPILVYAPKETALSIYANREKWGYTVEERNAKILYKAIKELYSNKSLREQYGRIARKLAFKNHNAINIRNKFHKLLCEAMEDCQ